LWLIEFGILWKPSTQSSGVLVSALCRFVVAGQEFNFSLRLLRQGEDHRQLKESLIKEIVHALECGNLFNLLPLWFAVA